MPELPEVETSRCGIEPHIINQVVDSIIIRQSKLRWPIPDAIHAMVGETITAVKRRGKYLLLVTEKGSAIIHLGMSGSLRIFAEFSEPQKHDHVDILFRNKTCLRYTDPRRFGAVLWTPADPLAHPLLAKLGPEPLLTDFNPDYLFQRTQKSQKAVKAFIMDSHIVVGVGNIYATVALFDAGIHPVRAAKTLSIAEIKQLVGSIKRILKQAIKQGGTTLRDFQSSDGKPGYFKQQLRVYGRAGLACKQCAALLQKIQIGQRTTVYCPDCQV